MQAMLVDEPAPYVRSLGVSCRLALDMISLGLFIAYTLDSGHYCMLLTRKSSVRAKQHESGHFAGIDVLPVCLLMLRRLCK